MTVSRSFLKCWNTLPEGTFEGWYKGHRYSVIRTVKSGGRQGWIWAEELGGTNRISANLYILKNGPQLRPCEMPATKVIDFVCGLELRNPDQEIVSTEHAKF